MKSRALVSTIIPTHNSEETLVKCLSSIKNQRYFPIEILVVDNFSDDATQEIAKRFGARVIVQKSNPGSARNIGALNSTGIFVLFLDSDQSIHPLVIGDCVDLCIDKGAGMVDIPEIFIGNGFWSTCSAVWKNSFLSVERKYGRDFHGVPPGIPRFFVKRYLEQSGMFNTTLLWGEDYEVYERLRRQNVHKAMCKYEIRHYEPRSFKGLAVKSAGYGESMPIFVGQTRKQILPLLARHALSTFAEVAKNSSSLAIIGGCALLLLVKAQATMMGLMAGLLFGISLKTRSI